MEKIKRLHCDHGTMSVYEQADGEFVRYDSIAHLLEPREFDEKVTKLKTELTRAIKELATVEQAPKESRGITWVQSLSRWNNRISMLHADILEAKADAYDQLTQATEKTGGSRE